MQATRQLLTTFISIVASATISYSTTFTVISAGDNSNGGTLREAINNSNNTFGPDTIIFDITPYNTPHTIFLTQDLPNIGDKVFINGYSQNGSDSANGSNPAQIMIEINGQNIVFNGLVLDSVAAFSEIIGLVINKVQNAAIEINVDHVRIHGNHIGTDSTGTDFAGNDYGITIYDSQRCTIGGNTPGQRNIISDNLYAGIEISGIFSTDNIVSGNYIGTDALGTSDLPNGDGIALFGGANGNQIGGPSPGEKNVISGNAISGVSLSEPGTSDNRVIGNIIGLDINGVKLPNLWGVDIYGVATDNYIGGTGPNDGNTISGNTLVGVSLEGQGTIGNRVYGNKIGTDNLGQNPASNMYGVAIGVGAFGNFIGGGGTNERNIISGNDSTGVFIDGFLTSGNSVKGNYIGTDIDGDSPLTNNIGVMICDDASANTIGGTSIPEYNVISGNFIGVVVTDPGTNGNVITGNTIGTNYLGMDTVPNNTGILITDGATNTMVGGNVISGNNGSGIIIEGAATTDTHLAANRIGLNIFDLEIPNGNNGIELLNGTKNNFIGEGIAGLANIISANVNHGIYIEGQSTRLNLIQGNHIGTTQNGLNMRGNGMAGIELAGGANNNTIGGSNPAEKNVICGNEYGIKLLESGTSNNIIIGNYIGTDSTGTGILANNSYGIYLGAGADGNIIGKLQPNERNYISNNWNAGIFIESNNNRIINNSIGTDSSGTALVGNAESGIYIADGANDNNIGDTVPNAGNVIANNGSGGYGNGITLDPNAGIGNLIVSNRIFQNKQLGIDLGDDGVTANDSVDVDSGPNDRQNYPVITKAQSCGTQKTIIDGTFGSYPNDEFFLQFFRNTTLDGSAHGEGEVPIGSRFVFTDDSGMATFQFTFPVSVPLGQYITATASRVNTACTSEFSRGIRVAGTPKPILTDSVYTYCKGDSISEIILLSLTSGATYSWYSDQALTDLIAVGDTFYPPVSEPGSYTFYVTQGVQNDCESPSSQFDIIINECDSITLNIYNAFSPNNDGTNDVWEIDGIEGYHNRVFIYNRWGALVNDFTDYNNKDVAWNGTNKEEVELPDATYFYVIDMPDRNWSGWVQITR